MPPTPAWAPQKLPEGPVRFQRSSEKDRLPPPTQLAAPRLGGATPHPPTQGSALPNQGQPPCNTKMGESGKDIADLEHVWGSGLL